MYLILSTITALLECGPIFLGIRFDYTPGQILLLCFAYQFGNLFSSGFCRNQMAVTCGLSALFLLPASLIRHPLWLQHGLFFLGIVLLSVALQNARGQFKGTVSTVAKRLARVTGFLLSPVVGYLPVLFFALCPAIILTALWQKDDREFPSTDRPAYFHAMWQNPSCHIMLWHQLHYFSYAYGTILVFYSATENAFLTMLVFACTWMTYLMTEPLLHFLFPARESTYTRRYLFIGHTFLLLILLLLPMARSTVSFAVLWILTGFGGGTVFAITALFRESPDYHQDILNYTENIGHFAGSGIAAIWALFFPDRLNMLPYLSSICVIAVLIRTIHNHTRKENL